MSKFFSNKKLIIVLITLVAMIGLLAITMNIRNRRNTPPVVQQIGNDTAGVVSQVVSAPVSSLQTGFTAMVNLVNTYQDNQQLKKQLDELQQTRTTNTTLKRENQDLKRQLKLDSTLTDYKRINAAVITRSPSDWQDQVVINKGSTSGIVKNMPVMAGSGLLGRIVEVNKLSSKVELISTTNKNTNRFAIEIQAQNGNSIDGIVTGYDANRKELIVSQLTSTDGIVKGDIVSTSGLGGLTPRGLYVGTTVDTRKDDYGLTNSVYVKPAANINNFTVVTVINRSVEGG